MAPSTSSRSRPFGLIFHPAGPDGDAGTYKPRAIPINSAPVEIENAHFKGNVILIHDTGNEPETHAASERSPAAASEGPGPLRESGGPRRGVELQIQGKFKRSVERGGETTHGLWVGGELPEALKLGWIMQNVVQLCMRYARKKTEGRLHFTLGGKTEQPHLSFPIGQLFTCISTPPDAQPPQLGSEELRAKKWPGPEFIDISSENTYTLLYKTPYLDLCSWELLKVPGVSPLPIESILGDLSTARVMMYDLGACGGVQTQWRKGALLEWVFTRGAEGDAWMDQEEQTPRTPKALLADDDADDEADDASEQDAEEDALVAVDDQQDVGSDSSESEADSIYDMEEDEEESRADSQALEDIAGWRPSAQFSAHNALVRVPYYIEAIDRRRRRKVKTWYVIALGSPDGGDDWWHAKAAADLASLCRPKRRLGTFRRGPGARRYTCCSVKTLEQFRHVVCQQLSAETTLRSVVMRAAAVEADKAEAGLSPCGQELQQAIQFEDLSPRGMTPARLARKVQRVHGPVLPPRFFVGSGSACGLAFAHAREGRNALSRETLVGAIHFEGRLCEELMRLSTDGTVRCFTPFDCDKPRVRLRSSDFLSAQPIEGLFLGRFHLWQVATVLREFLFCSNDQQERDEWVQAIQGVIEAAKSSPELVKLDTSTSKEGVLVQRKETAPVLTESSKLGLGLDKFNVNSSALMSKVNSTLHTTLHFVSLRYSLVRDPGLTDSAALLTDSTRARRWRNPRRLVLNDRVLLAEGTAPPPPSIAEFALEAALRLPPQPPTDEMISFENLTCKLKAVRFAGWSQQELLAFWLNVHHCLLLHGWLVLGRPASRNELKRFHFRVSYLVGLRPVSLREIERVILRIPNLDSTQDAVRAEAGARARQLMGFCGLCRRRLGLQGPAPSVAASSTPHLLRPNSSLGEGDKKSMSPQPTVSQVSINVPRAKTGSKAQCLPMPALPKPPWMSFTPHHACLYLGKDPETFTLPKLDLRCGLCLNRGTYNCLAEIPVFHAKRLSSELDDASRKFVRELTQVEARDGRLIRVSAPEICRAIAQELGQDPKAVLRFLWHFMPPEHAAPSQGTKLKYHKGNEEPRHLVELRKLVWIDPKLMAEDANDLANARAELEAIGGTAQALAKLTVRASGRREGDESPAKGTDVVIDMCPAEAAAPGEGRGAAAGGAGGDLLKL